MAGHNKSAVNREPTGFIKRAQKYDFLKGGEKTQPNNFCVNKKIP